MTQKEVLLAVKAQAPDLLRHIYVDRDWLWLVYDLRGEENELKRNAIKSIGFRFCKSGHAIGELTAHWGHCCEHPIKRTFKKRGHRPRFQSNTNNNHEDADAALEALDI